MTSQHHHRKRFQLSKRLTRDGVLLALVVIVTILTTLAMAGSKTPSLAYGLFQTSPINTPDPNSASATPPALPTTPLPSPTFPSGVVPTVPPPGPTATFPAPAVPPTPLPNTPPAGGGVIPPTPTPFPTPLPALSSPIQPPPTATATPTITPTATVAPAQQPPAEPEAVERQFDLALFIDNLVIALGYIWICCGLVFLAAAAIGAVVFLRRTPRSTVPPAAPAGQSYPPPGNRPPPEPTSPPPPPPDSAWWGPPAPTTPWPADSAQPAAPQPVQRQTTARHAPTPPDDLDHPLSS